jgi:hypothetical protein
MKKLIILLFTLSICSVSNAQMTKTDVKEIFSSIDMNQYPKFYITFNSEGGNKHKMENENLASYEALDPKTTQFEYKKTIFI